MTLPSLTKKDVIRNDITGCGRRHIECLQIVRDDIAISDKKDIVRDDIAISVISKSISYCVWRLHFCVFVCWGKKKKLNNQKDWHLAMKASSLGTPFLRLHVLGFFVSRNNE